LLLNEGHVFQYNISRPLKSTRKVVVSFQVQNICGMKSKPLKYPLNRKKIGKQINFQTNAHWKTICKSMFIGQLDVLATTSNHPHHYLYKLQNIKASILILI
jgi:hypothetical protein